MFYGKNGLCKLYSGKKMTIQLRTFIIAGVLLICSIITLKSINYFINKESPKISLTGIQEGKSYCADIQCSINTNKTGIICLWLDDQQLIRTKEKIVHNRDYPFTIPTHTLTNGKHAFKAEVTDNTYHANKGLFTCSFNVDNLPLTAALVQAESDYKVLQGRTLHLQFQVNKEISNAWVSALSTKYPCFAEAKNSSIYECFIPIPCEQTPQEYIFSIEINDLVGNTLILDNKFQVVLFPFKKETLHVSPEKIKEEKEKGNDQQLLEAAITEIVSKSPTQKLWCGPFCMPIDNARITCDFGTVRTTQEKGRYIHQALDLINTPKSVVWAPQNGIVAHLGRYATSGNTVILDHGFGVLTLFFHLDSIADIKAGQKIAKGNPVGLLGKTGYATGYHLHWEMRVGKDNIPVDPLQWTKQNF